ncbi:two component, sigma54 specific, transcriptional regulator, Fis family [Desulfovibrio sp. X2]|uniref:sigma-54-dependent transcriptional regulator n=1 Tax=Desulfovibrio sp. X2 TaxID=941449 RepID=UPI0003586FE4|nr:sigma-54 dependent transcriptional regulator [Desulfovibrio sp. X2]EPR37382.1 two component, sigma54 specific, transcriptional regulator, Fis family [Desulfovibrio sp. X2]
MAKILIVDDDAQLRLSFERLLAAEGHEVLAASSGEAGIEAVKAEHPELVVMDVRMPGMNGLTAFQKMRGIDARLPVIVMTAYGTTETAIEAIKMGAFDYILKPFEIPAILALIGQALESARLMRGKVAMNGAAGNGAAPEGDALIGKSPAMHEVYKAIGRVAATDATVLVRGESGTGKELVARAVYQHSQRADRPFVVINCVAIPETLLESELFGYEKGAFTGAATRRVGKIEQANHGTIFLDEIGDMPVNIQAKLLRLLQERTIERLGGRQSVGVDVRIIAATNRDLEAAVAEGRFREDLYYRLKVVTLSLPPLRERLEDVGPLAEYFLARFAREMRMDNPGLTPDAASLLTAQTWPGNVRELANTVQKTLIFNRGAPISRSDVSAALGATVAGHEPGGGSGATGAADPALREWVRAGLAGYDGHAAFEDLMDAVARELVREALDICEGNRTRAARLLGLTRPTLLAKMDKYGLKVKATVSDR